MVPPCGQQLLGICGGARHHTGTETIRWEPADLSGEHQVRPVRWMLPPTYDTAGTPSHYLVEKSVPLRLVDGIWRICADPLGEPSTPVECPHTSSNEVRLRPHGLWATCPWSLGPSPSGRASAVVTSWLNGIVMRRLS